MPRQPNTAIPYLQRVADTLAGVQQPDQTLNATCGMQTGAPRIEMSMHARASEQDRRNAMATAAPPLSLGREAQGGRRS